METPVWDSATLKSQLPSASPPVLPVRQQLCHAVPSWVQQGARHFITVNARTRGSESLVLSPIADRLLQSVRVYEKQSKWYPWLVVVMPDHLHMIVTFVLDRGLRRTMATWKAFHAKQSGVQWQSDFFEHRLRNDNEFTEKAAYVRLNPVRKELVADAGEWPYSWERRSGE